MPSWSLAQAICKIHLVTLPAGTHPTAPTPALLLVASKGCGQTIRPERGHCSPCGVTGRLVPRAQETASPAVAVSSGHLRGGAAAPAAQPETDCELVSGCFLRSLSPEQRTKLNFGERIK